MDKDLYIVVADYPFGYGEPFLEDELKQLEKEFTSIHIIITDLPRGHEFEKIFYLPFQTTLHYFSLKNNKKLGALKFLFTPLFIKEVLFILLRIKQKLRLIHIKTILEALQQASQFKNYLSNLIPQKYSSNNRVFIYSYWCNNFTIGMCFYKKIKPENIVFSRAHGWDLYFERSKYNYLPLRNFIFSKLDVLFAISDNGRNYLQQKFTTINPNKIKTSRLGVENNFPYNISPKDSTKLELLSISNLIPVKRIELLIAALNLITDIEINWTHIGQGVDLEKIKTYAFNTLKNHSNIKVVFKGLLKKKEIIDLLNSSDFDLFINVSSSEGIPVSIMEAMSFRIPCIATAVGGTSEIVNNENGYLLYANPSPEEIAEKILEFYTLSFELKELKRKAAYNTWDEKFNAEKNYSDFIDKILQI
jgi:glycosyltransferase involved in cell wall biosynthesis